MRTTPRPSGRLGSKAAILAGLLALTLGPLTACGGDDTAGGGVAAASGDGSADSGSGDPLDGDDGRTPADPDEQILAFTECLRENGLDVEDPAPGEGLQLRFGPETDRGTVDAAMEACREFAPGAGAGGTDIDPEAAMEHAKCMRKNGVEAFPDPGSDGRIMIGPDVADDPDFEAASAACDKLLGLP